MFGSMRRKERELSEDTAQRILACSKYGILSVICENGYPYGVPIYYVMMNGKIYFHSTSERGMKKDAVKKCPNVSFTVLEPLDDLSCQSVILFGTVQAASELRSAVLEKIIEKFVPETQWERAKSGIPHALDKVEAYEITVQHLTAKSIQKPEGR